MSESNASADEIEVFMQITPEMLMKLERLSSKLDCDVAGVVAMSVNFMNFAVKESSSGKHLGFTDDRNKLDEIVDLSSVKTDS